MSFLASGAVIGGSLKSPGWLNSEWPVSIEKNAQSQWTLTMGSKEHPYSREVPGLLVTPKTTEDFGFTGGASAYYTTKPLDYGFAFDIAFYTSSSQFQPLDFTFMILGSE